MPNNLSGEFVLKPDTTQKPPEKMRPVETLAMEDVPAPTAAPKLNLSTPRQKPHFYSSLSYYPEGITFLNQDQDEEVVLLIRRDFITNLPWILSIILLIMAPPVVYVLAPFFIPALNVSQPLIFLSFSFYYLVVFGFTLLYFAIWYFNVGLVTNKRILDLDVPNILIKDVAEARLNTIADVSFNQTGTVRSFFDYGNVLVQVDTFHQNIEFDRAPNPNMIRKVIGDLVVNKP